MIESIVGGVVVAVLVGFAPAIYRKWRERNYRKVPSTPFKL